MYLSTKADTPSEKAPLACQQWHSAVNCATARTTEVRGLRIADADPQ